MFMIDTGAPTERFDAIEDAAKDALPEDASRKEVLCEAARLLGLKLDKLKSREGLCRNFWKHSRLIAEMAVEAPEAHDALVSALFWGLADPDEIDRICDAANPMPGVA
jgi:hypothetical protein